MNIYYLSAAEIPSKYAHSVHIMKMCQALTSAGHRVKLFCLSGQFQSEDDFIFYGISSRFEIIKINKLNLKFFGRLYNIIRMLGTIARMSRPDLFLGRDLFTLFFASFLGRPLIYESHIPPYSWLSRHVERWLLKRRGLKRLVVISEALKKIYVCLYPWLDETKILVAHDGADIPKVGELKFKTVLKNQQNVVPQAGLTQARMEVGYVGHLYPGRGIDIIIELARRLPEVNFHIIGGYDDDVIYWSRQTELTNLHFYGFVPNGELSDYYASLDIVLAPYQSKVTLRGSGDTSKWMSPLKLFEYMAQKKPIICSDIAVLREVLTDGENALMVPPEGIESWAEAIKKLFDPALRNKIGEAGFQTLCQKYSWDKRAQAILQESPKSLKLLFMTDTMACGGAERSMITLLQTLQDEPDLTIKQLLLEKVVFYEMPASVDVTYLAEKAPSQIKKFLSIPSYIFKTRKLKKRLQPDICLSFQYRSNVINICSNFWLGHQTKCVISERNYTLNSFARYPFISQKLFLWLISLTYPLAHHIICNATNTRDYLLKLLRMPPDKISIIFNGFATTSIRAEANLPIDSGDKELFARGKKIILSVGSLTYQKGYDYLIRAYAQSPQLKKDYLVVILGEGRLRDHLSQLIKTLACENNIFLLGNRRHPYRYMKQCDVFVMCSRYEGYPNALVEAIICQKPIACFDFLAGADDIFGEQKTALVKSGDLDALSHKILNPIVVNPENIHDLNYLREAYRKLFWSLAPI